MRLFYMPLACSMASRIAFNEAQQPVEFVLVDPRTKRTETGEDYSMINPLAQVPALELDDGEILLENMAILQKLAEALAGGSLGAAHERERFRLVRWLAFINSELHAQIFHFLLKPDTPGELRSHVLELAPSRLAVLERHLSGREFIMDGFTVADCYLFAVLNWFQATPLRLSDWPALKNYHDRLAMRPSVQSALAVEIPLWG